jgi:hypothetical protein
MLSSFEMLYEAAGLLTISYSTARVSRIIEGDKKTQLSQTAYPAVSHHNQYSQPEFIIDRQLS